MIPAELVSLFKLRMILGVVSSSICSLVGAALIGLIIYAVVENSKSGK